MVLFGISGVITDERPLCAWLSGHDLPSKGHPGPRCKEPRYNDGVHVLIRYIAYNGHARHWYTIGTSKPQAASTAADETIRVLPLSVVFGIGLWPYEASFQLSVLHPLRH